MWKQAVIFCAVLAFVICFPSAAESGYENEKCLTSPGYPDIYPNNTHKRQLLSVVAGHSIEITFKDFDVENDGSRCRYDYVQFYDDHGNLVGGRLCGNLLPEKLTILNSTASVLFSSDRKIRRKGFKFCYKPGIIINKCLTSPGYPDRYPDNSHIRQPLSVAAGQSIEITFEDFDVENDTSRCRHDYVEFYDENGNCIGERLCGNLLPEKLIILNSTASVLFNSDRKIRRKGFKFCYKPGTTVVPGTTEAAETISQGTTVVTETSEAPSTISQGTTVVAQTSEAPPTISLDEMGCPKEGLHFGGGFCFDTGRVCEFGTQECCGEIHPTIVMSCEDNVWSSMAVDTGCFLFEDFRCPESTTTEPTTTELTDERTIRTTVSHRNKYLYV